MITIILNNPFIESISSSDWNTIVKSDQFNKHHMTGENIELFKNILKINYNDFSLFEDEYKKFSRSKIQLTDWDKGLLHWS